MENQNKNPNNQTNPNTKPHPVWDCGSTLYDSYELQSLKRTLDSAISSRTFSMPHLPDHHHYHHHRNLREQPPPPPPPPPPQKRLFKISRTIHKLIKSVFKHSKSGVGSHDGGFFFFYDKSGALSTIPEGPEVMESPEIGSFVRRTVSERFAANSTFGISCA